MSYFNWHVQCSRELRSQGLQVIFEVQIGIKWISNYVFKNKGTRAVKVQVGDSGLEQGHRSSQSWRQQKKLEKETMQKVTEAMKYSGPASLCRDKSIHATRESIAQAVETCAGFSPNSLSLLVS